MIGSGNQLKQPFLSQISYHSLLFLGIIALYALLIVPTIKHLGIGWDEEVDLRISQAYLTPRGFFFGIPHDLSQTRLPMFAVGLIYRLSGRSDLLIARWASVVVGGLTLLGIYVYGKDYFNHNVGLLAAGMLAVNPFFLSFARLAFTESDVYLACTLTWLLVTVARLLDKPTFGRAAVAGAVLGLCISAKATVLVILPAVWASLYYFRTKTPKYNTNTSNSESSSLPAKTVLFWAGWTGLVLLVGVFSGMIVNDGNYSSIYRLLHYGLIGLGWLIPLFWGMRFWSHIADPIPLAAFVTGFGILTFVIFPPDHLTNSGILRSIFLRANNEMSFNAAFVGELAALHLLTVIFKSTPVVGGALLVGTIASLAHWKRREVMLPLFIGISYLAGLLLLPLGQTFYTLPILPILSLLVAFLIYRFWSIQRKVVLITTVLAFSLWGVEMIQSYPDYHLNGYQWLGERVLFGRSSIGYRSVVYTPSDGVQQAVEWLNANAKPGQVAQLYVSEWHIVRSLAPEPAYQLTNGFEETLSSQPDYVVIHKNALLQQGHGNDTPQGGVIRHPYNKEILTRDYEQVFVVRRAFNVEMASVWQRKLSGSAQIDC